MPPKYDCDEPCRQALVRLAANCFHPEDLVFDVEDPTKGLVKKTIALQNPWFWPVASRKLHVCPCGRLRAEAHAGGGCYCSAKEVPATFDPQSGGCV